MKRVFLVLIVFSLFIGNIFADETYLIYENDFYGSISIFALYANVVDNNILSYSIRNNNSDPLDYKIDLAERNFRILLTKDNFNNFHNAVGKFIEWGKIARDADVDSFTKEIPINVETGSMIWTKFSTVTYTHLTFTNNKVYPIIFLFNWKNNKIRHIIVNELIIKINNIESDNSADTFDVYYQLEYEDVLKLYESTTQEGVDKAIQKVHDDEIKKQQLNNKINELFQ